VSLFLSAEGSAYSFITLSNGAEGVLYEPNPLMPPEKRRSGFRRAGGRYHVFSG